MSLWGRAFAFAYDATLARSERNGLSELRAGLLAGAAGRVLEIGAGTGINLQHYPREGIAELVVTEPEAPMARRLEDRVAGSGRDAQVVRAPAGELPFADASFDVVVCTLVLCTVPDPAKALAELRRVLVPDGRLLFLEHVSHDDAARARRQRLVTPAWRHVACGCHADRDTPRLIAQAGFDVVALRREHFPKAMSFLQPLAVGTAVR